MTDLHLTIEELRLRRAIALLAMDYAKDFDSWVWLYLEAVRLNHLVELGEQCEHEYQHTAKSA